MARSSIYLLTVVILESPRDLYKYCLDRVNYILVVNKIKEEEFKLKKPCSLKVYNGSRYLYGTAAQLHKISIEGGWDSYHEKLVQNITSRVTKEVLNELNSPVLKLVK